MVDKLRDGTLEASRSQRLDHSRAEALELVAAKARECPALLPPGAQLGWVCRWPCLMSVAARVPRRERAGVQIHADVSISRERGLLDDSASLAQLAEHALRKRMVTGSIPVGGLRQH